MSCCSLNAVQLFWGRCQIIVKLLSCRGQHLCDRLLFTVPNRCDCFTLVELKYIHKIKFNLMTVYSYVGEIVNDNGYINKCWDHFDSQDHVYAFEMVSMLLSLPDLASQENNSWDICWVIPWPRFSHHVWTSTKFNSFLVSGLSVKA